MDILISSNLERLIYKIAGEDPARCREFMGYLSTEGKYTITPAMKEQLGDFYGDFATEAETAQTIARIFRDTGYMIDPHTAVAAAVYGKYKAQTGDGRTTVIASTASPYKFTRSVLSALDAKYDSMTDFELVDALHGLTGVPIPRAIEEIRTAPILHDRVVDAADMPKAVRDILRIS